MEEKVNKINMGKDGVALVFTEEGVTMHSIDIGDNETAPMHMLMATAIMLLIKEYDEEFSKILSNRVNKMIDEDS